MKRRVFLQSTLASGAASMTGLGLLVPHLALAEDAKPADPAKTEPTKVEEPAKAEAKPAEAAKTETAAASTESSPFTATSYEDALKGLNIATPEESDKVLIKAPEIAENGAVVPVTISTTLEGATQMGLLIKNNPTPLAAIFTMGEGTEPNATTRIKMAKTSDVVAFVKVGDKTYSAKQEVKVTLGGCGG
ncbi:thiosulfate oxidation carrier protein SoxY [Thiolinea disciformis]|uniref:thiosulfate oxidation carrier protein SoxY n=1 Tax=Thiolinea disciformis TaxID=125614 RepID=UPI0003653477|nr:thiosulfate oxidation carrier protein SoxY [Thiolinea disciformis]